MMDQLEVDVAVVGAGTAGLGAHRAAKQCGARTVLIDPGPWGTTCVRVGCMPSKLLLTAANAARDLRRASAFGVQAERVNVDGAQVMSRLHSQREHFLRSILDDLAAMPAEEKIDGRARFSDAGTLTIDDRLQVKAKAIVIATGSRTSVPKAFEAVGARVLTNETVFELDALPKSIAVVGAGAVGIELGIAFARLGVRTTVFDESDSIGGLKDPDVLQAARELLGAEVDLKLGVTVNAERHNDGVRVIWHDSFERGEAVYEYVLAAAGKPPNLDELNLAATGLDLDDHGTPKHDRATLRCRESAIFIAGDAGSDLPVLHEASRQGGLAGRNAASRADLERQSPPAALSIVFTDPDIASIGASLPALGETVVVGRHRLHGGRGEIEDRKGGLISLYADPQNRRLLGGEMVGAAVEHLAHLLAAMVQLELTVDQALAWPFYHPTYEEQLQTCLRDLRSNLDR